MLKTFPAPHDQASPAVSRRSGWLPIFLSIRRWMKIYLSNFHFRSRS